MVTVAAGEVTPAASLTVALKLTSVAVAGTVPESTPVLALKVSQLGRLPDVTLRVKGAVPPLTTAELYELLPLVILAGVVMVGLGATAMLIEVDFVESLTEVAVTVTVSFEVTLEGAL
jgi:hypothetical protein